MGGMVKVRVWVEDRVGNLVWVDDVRCQVLNKMQSIDNFGGESGEKGVALISMGGDN